MTTASAHTKPLQLTPEQTAAIKSELGELLNSAQFSGTKRCYEFLEFVVSHALAGEYENLTERTLGAEVFGRPINYETGTDAIVRVTANDVRRRLAEYYSEQQPDSRVCISLPSGGYVPEFRWPSPKVPAALTDASYARDLLTGDATMSPPATAEPPRGKMRRRLKKSILIAAALLLAVSGGLTLFLRDSAHSERTLRQFWQPVIDKHSPVIVCFGDTASLWSSSAPEQTLKEDNHTLLVKPEDVSEAKDESATEGNIRAAMSILNLLSGYGVTNELRWPQEVQSAELDKSNVIYIGAFNNPWSMSLNRDLRFSFKEIHTPSQWSVSIEDRTSPNRNWSITKVYPGHMGTDYALITRIIDRDGKRVVISVGGLRQSGTEAAGEFLTDEAEMSALARTASTGWEHRNLQIVLGMNVDGRKIVNPRILATNVW